MQITKLNFIVLSFFLLSQSVYAQNYKEYAKKQFVDGKDTLNYRILAPEKLEEGKKYPLLLFLHGAGERGANNKRQLIHGAKLFVNKKNREDYPAIVLFPQCPNDIMWTHRTKKQNSKGEWVFNFPLGDGPTKPAELVNELVKEYLDKEYVDTTRVYVMGLSMGGIGTLEFLYRWPEKYAAAAVICGGHDPKLAATYCKIPIWFFHGGKDKVVPKKYSQNVYKELLKCNDINKYTFYPDANHNSWDSAFAEPKLLEWLFGFNK